MPSINNLITITIGPILIVMSFMSISTKRYYPLRFAEAFQCLHAHTHVMIRTFPEASLIIFGIDRTVGI